MREPGRIDNCKAEVGATTMIDGEDAMFEEEKERGRRIARLSPKARNELIARLMFGESWRQARSALVLLMEAWGMAEPADLREVGQGGEAVGSE